LSIKVSDYMDGAPDDVTESLAWYILCRIYGRECPESMSARYLEHARSRDLWAPKRQVYLSRAKGLSFRPRGEHRDLGEIFDYVNSCYFDGEIPRPDLAWARESPSKRLGFYFGPLDLLAVNRVLDSERIPRYVPEFVVYHELLHDLILPGGTSERRMYHTREFRRREQEFSMFEPAQDWLSRIARPNRNRGVPRA